MNNRLINTKVAGGGGGCTDIVDEFDPFGGNGVALYQLNGDATDESGNYDATTVNAITWGGAGVFGTSAAFNGSSSWIRNTSFVRPTDYTVSIWLKSDTTSGERIAIALNWTGSRRFGIALKDGGIKYQNGDSGWLTILSSLSTNTWYNIVTTYNSSTDDYAAYINGSQTVSGNNTIAGTTLGSGLYLGQFGTSGGYWDGSIDQVRIFDTALDPLEVEALYTEELCICDGTVDTLQVLGDTSCIATYQLDGNANDLSGNYSGEATDVSYGVGEFDLAGVFNGSTSYVSGLPTFTNKTGVGFSASFWFKADSTPASAQNLIGGINPNPEQDVITIQVTTAGYINYQTRAANTSPAVPDEIISSVNYCDGNWHNLVFTLSTTTMSLFIDNNLISGSPKTLSFSSNTQVTSPVFGAFNNRGTVSSFFTGSIDQVRIFNKALNQNEVNTLFAETPCTYTPKSNLILHLDANDSNSWTGSGSTWFDVSGNDYNADIVTPVPSTGTVGSTTYLNLSTRDDYFKIPIATHGGALSPKAGNKLSYLFWMNYPSVPSGVNGLNNYLFTKTASSVSTAYARYYKPSTEGHQFFIYDNAGNNDINSGYVAPSTTNKWMMVVLTMDYTTGIFGQHRYGDGMTTYHNYNMGTVSPYPTDDSDIFLFNSDEPTYGGYGYVGEIKVFDKPLNEIEMGIEYNNGKIKYGIS